MQSGSKIPYNDMEPEERITIEKLNKNNNCNIIIIIWI